MGTETPLIGRDVAVTDLVGRGERAVAGEGGLVLLSGEAGVGKTRLALAALERLGVPVLVGAGSESGTAPYGPLVDVLRAFRRLDPDGLDELGRSREHLALLLPELGETAPDADRFAVATAICAAFASLVRSGPIAVLVDDLHWADEATLDVLPGLAETASGAPLFLLGAYRSDELPRGHALRRARTALRRARRLDELSVEPLGAAGTAELAAAILEAPLSPALAAALWDRTEGVPFFVEEVSAALAASDRVVPSDGGLRLRDQEAVPLPDTVRDAVLARVDGIRPETRAALEVAAAFGTVFELDVVGALAGDAGVEEAVPRGLIVEQADGRAAFRHALAREAIYAETTWSRRRHLHAELATVLAARGAPPETIAGHALAAGRTDVARLLLLDAAESYCAVHAYRDAARVARRALELWPGDADEPRRAEALARLGRCLHFSGNPTDSVAVWREVVDLRGRAGDAVAAAEAQRELAQVLDLSGRAADALAAHTAAAEGFLQAGRRHDAARERFAVAQSLHALGSHAEAAAEQRRVQALAAEIGDEDLRLKALAVEGVEHARQGDVERGLDLAREALARSLEGGHADAGAEAYWANAAILLAAGDLVAARTTLEHAVDFCAQTGEEAMRRFCTSCLSFVLWRTGAWDRAAELAQAVRGEEADPYDEAYAALTWGCVEVARGRARRARPLLAAAAAFHARVGLAPGLASSLELALAQLDVLAGESDAAVDRCRRVLAEAESSQPDARHTAVLRWASALFGGRALDRETRACAAVLAAVAGTYPHPEARAAAAAALGEVALCDGDPTAAASYLGHAVELLGELELPYEEAQVQLRAAAACASAGDRDTAVDRLVAAYRIARRLGAQPLSAEAARSLEALGERVDARLGRLAAANVRGGGLTRRELEVVRLVAVGRTNREIAESLHLSPRTVEMHVRNALSKLECRTRTEASSRAIALGLIEPIPA